MLNKDYFDHKILNDIFSKEIGELTSTFDKKSIIVQSETNLISISKQTGHLNAKLHKKSIKFQDPQFKKIGEINISQKFHPPRTHPKKNPDDIPIFPIPVSDKTAHVFKVSCEVGIQEGSGQVEALLEQLGAAQGEPGTTPKRVRIQTSDGQVVGVPAEVLMMSNTLKHLLKGPYHPKRAFQNSMKGFFQIEGGKVVLVSEGRLIASVLRDDEELLVEFGDVKSEILKMAVEYCRCIVSGSEQDHKQWEGRFGDIDQNTLCELASTSYYLDIKPLVNLTSRTIANRLSGKTIEEIKESFCIKITNDPPNVRNVAFKGTEPPKAIQEDARDVDELLDFINESNDTPPTDVPPKTSKKSQKQKEKKKRKKFKKIEKEQKDKTNVQGSSPRTQTNVIATDQKEKVVSDKEKVETREESDNEEIPCTVIKSPQKVEVTTKTENTHKNEPPPKIPPPSNPSNPSHPPYRPLKLSQILELNNISIPSKSQRDFLQKILEVDPYSPELDAIFEKEEKLMNPKFKASIDKEVELWRHKLEQIYHKTGPNNQQFTNSKIVV